MKNFIYKTLLFLIGFLGVFSQCETSLNSIETDNLYYPGYHVRPTSSWMNDPNGPVQDPQTHLYHLFFQYNPNSVGFGIMEWDHAISKDLVFWQHRPIALKPSTSYDKDGCWSGSATIVDQDIYFTFTGAVGSDKTNNLVEYQLLAKATNSSLTNLVPETRPFISTPPKNVSPALFRDPTEAWYDSSCSCWKLLLGGGFENNKTGTALLYSSSDFKTWYFEKSIYENPNWGYMFECPDFFKIKDKWVLKASLLPSRQDYFALGSFENDIFTPMSDKTLLDSGEIIYATKSFYDKTNQRRILWSWVPETDPDYLYEQRGWAGIQSLPREFSIDKSGTIKIAPIPELSKLRESDTYFPQLHISPNDPFKFNNTLKTLQYEIEVNYTIDLNFRQEFGVSVLVGEALDSETRVGFNITQNTFELFVDLSKSFSSGSKKIFQAPLTKNNQLYLHIFVDHSILEVFAQHGETRITTRVYPPSISEPYGIEFFSVFNPIDIDLTVHTLKSIWI